ncbi:hypothetical protein PSEUBRA_002701 [Kalmanozyma brasiliensis GHG001]|uniref:Uncharacterized protein n=1 Tax=Kalmanozyma brasiliensis (strain GHG001) TaxID=1365824 RepID=V5EB50_KALBG|nr:uncharacterized protein PSEUBRA_002701 [Kalmanozyma brasiliensis GHG001]EST07611.1 hypothetical protein PSEUBRA_002701 [Kalmanozyma brasiliensis GHG001]
MASPLRRSTRSARNADASGTTPEPSVASPSTSPSKLDRKRKRADEPSDPSADVNGTDEHMAEAAPDASADDMNKASSDLSDEDNGADAEGEAEPSTTQKQQLPKHIQSLLGLPGPSAKSVHAPKTADVDLDAAAHKAQELVLGEDDAQKLATILAALNFSDLTTAARAPAKGKLRSTNGSTDAKPTLRDMLRPGTSVRELRSHLQSLRQPLMAKEAVSQHLRAGQSATASEEVAKDMERLTSLTLVLGLVDQLASRQRQADTSTDALKGQILASIVEDRARLAEAKNAGRKGSANGAVDGDSPARIKPVGSPVVDPSTNRYALHMRLPRSDYFTKAIPLDKDQLSQLDAAQADLVQISAQSEEQMRALKRQGLVPAPTLGQRLGRSGHRHHRSDSKRAKQQGRPQPVTFLNYGNYASFAPTYDSSTSSISYATSSNLWRSSVRAQRSVTMAWGEKPFSLYDEEEEYEEDDHDGDAPVEPTPYSTATKPLASVDADGDISMDAISSDGLAEVLRTLIEDVDQGSVSKSLTKLDQDELVTSHLRFNMMLLHRLQEFQWARLRRSYRPSGRSSKSATEIVAPSAEEEATAALLLESLGALVALQPRAVDLTSNAVDSVIPDASKLRAFSASSGAIDPDLLGDVRDGFWGALDANVVKVTKGGSVISETPLVLRDDVTIRLVDGSGSKAKKSSRRGGPGAGHVEDRGRGALERFAATRTYDHKQDRHDVDPLRAEPVPSAGADQRDMSSPAMRQAAMSPNARMQPGYAPGAGPAMTPQSQRFAPGPNASYAFASPSGGLRPMQPNAQANYQQGQAARQ